MEKSDTKKQFWFRVALYAGAWTLVGLVLASEVNNFWLLRYQRERPFSRSMLVLWQMVGWYGWGLLTPLVLWLGRRFPFDRQRWLRSAIVHTLAGLILAALHLAFFTWTGRLAMAGEFRQAPFSELYRIFALNHLHFELLLYWAVLGSGLAFNYYRRYRERELAAAQLERQLVEAQLQALKMQLHPHFLFNTLNTIATLVRKQENDAAVQMLVGLGDLLRHALQQADKQEVPLKQELEFIEQYLEIEQARFRDRLMVRMQIAPETLSASVPNLILQPLVENAVRHGISQRVTAGLIEITARRVGHELHLQVRDDGPGLAAADSANEGQGVGLANTRARLERLYGEQHRFALQNGQGVTATVVIPFHGSQTETSQEHGQGQGKDTNADRG
ncbi:MAG: sensor histidine kinase [Acidobacteria bacterium]|nr:sensor histidine kinase [Acidobacteriota bacterium]